MRCSSTTISQDTVGMMKAYYDEIQQILDNYCLTT